MGRLAFAMQCRQISGNERVMFFCYMLVITCVYDPINVAPQSVAKLLDMTLSLDRMRAIENEPMQTGGKEFEPHGHDPVFMDVGFPTETASTAGN